MSGARARHVATHFADAVRHPAEWTSQRKAFGKPLNSQAVVRAKLAGIISEAEAAQNWLESVTYQMCKMSCASAPRAWPKETPC